MKISWRPIILPGDKKAIAFLLAIIALGIAAFHLLGDDSTVATTPLPSDSTAVHRTYSHGFQRQQAYVYDEPQPKAERFFFDPNTADSTQLLLLGLQPYLVKNIYRYRARGGVYRQPSDFARLYGLTQKQYHELDPYIRISPDYRPAAELVADSTPAPRDTTLYPLKLQAGERISLNTADSTALRKIPGVGHYYARQIERRRRQLGGFASADQLSEIDGLPEEVREYVEVDASEVKRMNVNQLTLNELKRHPYINFYQARAICDYRRLRGPLSSIDDLRLMKEFTDDDLRRLAPYIEF